MRIIRWMGPLIAALLPVAFAALADERSETQIFRASTNLNVAPTLISPSVGEAVMPVSSEKLVSQNEKQGPIQSEARVALVSKLDADVPPELTQPIDVERFQEVQLTAAAKGVGSVVRSTAPRRGVHPAQKFGKNQLKLDPSAERQLLKINLALDDAKQSVQAAKSPVLRGGSSHKKTLAAPNKIALKSLNPSQVRVKHHKDGYVRRVSGQFKLESSSKSVTKQVDAFLLANYEELGLDPNFTYSLKESCNSSRCLIKAVKYFDGKEVFGDDLSLITVGDQIRTISGRMALWSSPAQAKMPASRANLEEIAKTHLGVVGEKLLADLDPVEGYRYVAGKYHSVMKLTVVTSMSDAWTVFVRTDSNQVIDKLPLSYDQSSVSSSGVDLLGETQAFFSQPLSNGAYRLIDDSFPATTGSQTTIGNMQNSEDFNAAVYVDAASSSGPWDAAAVSALVNSRKSYDYFKSRFGRNGIDGDDGEMLAFIHYKSNLVNAVYLDIGGGMMAYGDGDGVLSNSLARSLDVAGHELAHGVVARTAGLEYRFQSGALNESFADFFGTQIDGDDWLLGEDTWLQGPDCGGGQKCLRNMANPALSYSAQPTHMDEFQNLSIDVDKGGVHINSGIPNRALYLLAEGLSNAVGRSVAEQIAYQTLLALTPTSDFQDAAETMYEVTSVGDFSAAAAVAVADAWSGVGIEVEVQSPPPEVTPVETSSAQRSVIAYLYPDEGSTAYIPWLQSFDENTPAYDSARDGVALPSYADLSSPNPIGSFSRLSVAPENEDTEAGSYKGYWYAFVGDVDASGSHVYLNYFFNFTDSSTGNLVWAKASSPPAPIVYDNFTVQNIALSPNYANDGTFVLTIQDSPYIYVVTPDEVTSYAVSGPDYTSDGSGAAYVENIDSLRWDPSSRKVVFDYLSCVANPDGTCPSFWSVGVLDTVGAEVSYPFASQPPYIDLGYPAYSNTSDRYITMDLHRYDRDTGAYDSQSVIIFDTYEGGLYDSGAIPNGCGKDSAIWASPSFTSDDAWFIHQKCTGTPESYSNANYLTSRNEAGDLIETALNDYSSILPVATPGDEYHVDAYLEFRSRDSINEAGGANYSLTTPLAHGSPGVTLSGEFCWKNTTSVSSSILEAYTDDGIVSAFLPTTLKPGKAVCSTISIVPPKTLFENESGYIYVPKSIRSNAALSGSVRYSLEASLPEAPELSLYEAGADYLEITVDNISSGGDKTAVLYFDCGSFGATLDFSESGKLAQSKGVWSAHYDSGVNLQTVGLSPGTTFTCEAWSENRLGYSSTTSLTVATLSIDSDGDGVPDDEDAFPNDASESADSDGDGVGDNADAFPSDANETADSDGDGVGDNADAFPNDANETTDSDGDGVGDNADAFPNDPLRSADSDGDGVDDLADAFPDDPTETTDTDGDGVGDNADAFPNDANETADSDGDGVGDNADAFPNDANETADSDGDGVGDNADAFPNDANETADSDGDGVGDNADAFPNDVDETTDSDGDGVGDNADAFPNDANETTDSDGDGVGDNADAFPNDANETTDSDGDGVGDNADAFPNDANETADSDGDGVGDNADAFPNDANETADSDGDGVGDNADAFPNDANETADSDGDGVGDNADAFPNDPSRSADSDGDGVDDLADAFPDDPTETTDTDGDGVGDNTDAFPNDANETTDSDGDGVGDNADAFPNDANETADSDGDGVGDNADAFPNDANETADSDGDGVGDNADAFPNDPSRSADSDGDGVDDLADAFPDDPTETTDTDGDGVGDNTDAFPNDANETTDSDGDGVGDNADAFPNDANETADSDGDGVGDNADAFPNDANETADSDGDGVGDNADAFPNDPSRSADSDGDGVDDLADAFPDDPTETTDTDGDGVGDNADEFPNDPSRSADSDGDGVDDLADAFPDDPTETTDTDGDGVGDNTDTFPNDANETTDSDGDGVGDNADAFPNDVDETTDSDGDGVGDNADAFPNDANETTDSDGDGVGDNADAFPNDPLRSADSDGDGVDDLADAFPDDPTETTDTDGDGVGDNTDTFPNDANETTDSDGDGVGDNADAFPNDANETTDSDGDGVGDNADAFPNDANETADSDGDGVGDNADAFPNDANETTDSDGDGVGDNADAFPNDPLRSADSDGDGVDDLADAFPDDPTETTDTDGDGVGDNTDTFPNDANETTDSDGDGVGDNADAFPNDANETTDSDGDGVGDNADAFPNDANETTDSDSDGVGDNADAFPNDANETTDSDGDGVGDNADAFPNDANETTDSDSDGVGDNADAFPDDPTETTDTDGDGVGDNTDAFPNDANETTDSDGDGVGDNADAFPNDANETTDSDGDGVGDNADAFPNDANETADSDGDGVGDNADAFPNDASESTDIDGDGIGDNADVFPNDPSESADTDGDGVGDNADAFPNDASETVDTDGDGVGDNSDPTPYGDGVDQDSDGVPDSVDAFPLDPNETTDTDGDGVGNNADDDDDGDGVSDSEDAFPLDANETVDTDGDGVGNNSDVDDDGDGVADAQDAFPLDGEESADTDGDGVGNNADDDDDGDGVSDSEDAFPLDANETVDTDGDGVGNNSDVDDDGDGVADAQDAFPLDGEESVDTDGDGVGDNADSTPNGEDSDRDGDGVPDLEDAFPDDSGETVDTDNDGVGNNADADDDDDGVDDSGDAFPLDSTEWMDTDGDGIGNFADPDNPSGFCQSEYCVVNDAVSLSFYRVAPEARNVPFEFVLPDGQYQSLSGGSSGAISVKPAAAEEYTLFGASRYKNGQYKISPRSLLMSSNGVLSVKAVPDEDGGIVGIENAFFIETATDTGEFFAVFFAGEQTCSADGCPDVNDIDPLFNSVVLARPSEQDQCVSITTSAIDSDFDASRRTLIKLAPNLSVRSETSSNSDLLFGSSQNSFRLCTDTPPGTYNYEFTALDGIGGKSTFPLSVHIPESSVGGGDAYWGGTAADYDADGYENAIDDLPFDASESLDTDGDGIGDNADTDDDNDGALDSDDAFPLDPAETLDSDGDGVGDNSDPTPNGEDTDTDGDGVPDTEDAFPNDSSETLDTDGDGIGNNADTDDDGDGYPDTRSIAGPLVDAGATSVCGTNADGYWCEVGDPNDAYLQTDAPNAYGTELAVGIDRACLLTDNGLNCWGSGAGLEPSLSEASSLSGYARHFCALDSDNAHCWGLNVSQTFISDVALVAAGDGFTCVVASGLNNAQCWSTSGTPLTGHFTDNSTALYAGKDLVCAKGSFQEDEFINCWKPSGMDSPRRLYGAGIAAVSVGSEACIADQDGVTCLVNEPGTTNFNPVTYPDLATSRLVAGDGFTCAEINGVLDCWGDGSDLETRLEGRTVAAPAVAYDAFPLDASEWLDSDGDGVGNNADNDDDGDGVADGEDAFPLDSGETLDTDGDGIGDNSDPTPNGDGGDTDGDGVPDTEDAFPNDASESLDTDGDGIGNNADTDDDGDGVADGEDAFPLDSGETLDTDGDGIGDNSDPTPNGDGGDTDGDGVPDTEDAFPNNASESLDTDGDGIGNNADTDDDGDGYPDTRSDIEPLLDAGATSVCGTNADGYWCEVGDSNDAYLETDAPDAYGTELAVGIDRACLLTDNGLNCWGTVADSAPSLSEASSLSGYARHFCALDSGNAHCWGRNVSQTFISDVALVAAGDGFTCAVATGSGSAQCWSTSGTPLTGHFTDNPTALYAGKDLICAKGSFQENEFLNCWKPSGMDSPRRLSGNGISAASVGSEACIAHENGVSCLVNEPGTTNFNPVTYPDLATSRLVAGDGFTCAEINGVLDCWGDGSDLETRLEGRTVAAPAVAYDAFPLDASEWLDSDGDGVGNNADNDDDNDSVSDNEDAFPLDNSESLDTDGDGIGNNTDSDDDGDGVADGSDAFPLDSGETLDTDGDGLGNNTDDDDDGDGFSDQDELAEGSDPLNTTSVPEESGGMPIWMLYQVIESQRAVN